MFIKKQDAYEKKAYEWCTILEYDRKREKVSFAVAEIEKRYPEHGTAINEECEERYYVIEWKGKLHMKSKKMSLAPGDTVCIGKKKAYRLETKTPMKIAMICSPARSHEQHKRL